MTVRQIQSNKYGGLLSELPATPPSNWGDGTEYCCDDNALTARVVENAGVLSFLFSSGGSGGNLPAGMGQVYVDPIAGSDKNPGTITLPVQTLQVGLSRAPLLCGTLGCTVNVLSSIALGAGPVTQAPTLPSGTPVIVKAAITVQNGARVGAAGGTTGSLSPTPAGGTVVDSVGGFVVNAYAGMVVRFLTGPLSGVRATILSNSASTLTCDAIFPSAPTTTSTFQIEGQTTALSWTPGTSTNTLLGWVQEPGGPIVWDSFYVNLDVGLQAYLYCDTQWNACQCVATGANGAMLPSGGVHDFGGNTLTRDINGYAACGNYFVKVGIEASAGAAVNAINDAFTVATVDSINRSTMFMIFCACTSVSLATLEGTIEDHNSISVTPGNATTFAFRCDFGGVMILDTLDCSSFGAGSPPIACLNGSVLTMRKVTGTGNLNAVSTRIDQHSTLECKDASTGTTITAATTDLTVGPTTSTWAALLAGVALADASSQSYATTA